MEKRIRCTKCNKAFEVVGARGTSKEEFTGVTCPNNECSEPNEVMWPIDMPFFVRKIPSEM
jgi:phage FluMu protein Com